MGLIISKPYINKRTADEFMSWDESLRFMTVAATEISALKILLREFLHLDIDNPERMKR